MQKTYEWIEGEYLAKYGSGKTISAPARRGKAKPAKKSVAKAKASSNGKHKKAARKSKARAR
jgi:hypothetical protein